MHRKIVTDWKQFLAQRLRTLPDGMTIETIGRMTNKEILAIADQYPSFRELFLHENMLDCLIDSRNARFVDDETFIASRTAIDDHYGLGITVGLHARFLRILLARLGSADHVFDFCCGWGSYPTFLLSRNLYHGEITGSDGSVAMLKNAYRLMKIEGVNYTLRQAYAHYLPFDNCAFDFVYSIDALQYVTRWRQAIAELARVLEDGGRFLIIYPLDFGRQDIPLQEMLKMMESVELSPLEAIDLDSMPPYKRAIIYGQRDRR